MEMANWEITTENTIYEVFELLFLMLKRRLAGRLFESESEHFIADVWSMSLSLVRAHVCSF
jgi:hypothetical protein